MRLPKAFFPVQLDIPQFQAIFERSTDLVIITNARGTVRYVNPRFREVTGYSPEEAIGRNPRFLKSGDRPREATRALWQELLSGNGWYGRVRNRRKDGSFYWALSRIWPVADATGRIQHMVCTQQDLSEEERLSDQERLLGKLLEQSASVVIVTDLRGDIQYVNPMFTQVTGYAPEEALGRNPRFLRSGEMPPEFYKDLWARISSGQSVNAELHNRRKDGSLYWARVTFSPIRDGEGRITRYLGTQEDVTEKKEMLRRSFQAQKMEAVGKLAAGVAHEINNPLGIILGFAQSANRRTADGDPLKLAVRSIEREALRCQALVKDLLAFSRRSEGLMERLDLAEMVRGSLTFIEARARLGSVTIDLALPSGIYVTGDRTQLQQVVVNLCNNAIDAMARGGAMTLRVRGEVSPVGSVLEVSDTGAGIPADIVGRIFDPFFTTKSVGQGTGLGLSLVHEIVSRHRGQVDVASKAGAGTTFSVRFPPAAPPSG